MSNNIFNRIMKRISIKSNIIYHCFLIQLDFLKCWFLKFKQVIAEIDGDVPFSSKKRLCLFSHFDIQNQIDPYVICYLKSIFLLNCEIIFISTCGSLFDEDIKKIKSYVSKIILRSNVGLDFGSWKTALSYVKDIYRYHQIILCNDSVYGPLYDLHKVFETMERKNLDMWGITDSKERTYHLQSYFLVFNNRPSAMQFFTEFWNSYKFVSNKEYIINNYEIGITQKAIKTKLRIKAFCDYNEVLNEYCIKNADGKFDIITKRKGISNPMHYFWKFIIQNFQCPFIKIELLRDNPLGINGINTWPDILKQHTFYNENLIINHLKRIKYRIID